MSNKRAREEKPEDFEIDDEKDTYFGEDEEEENWGNEEEVEEPVKAGDYVSYNDRGDMKYAKVVDTLDHGEVEGEMHGMKVRMKAHEKPIAIMKSYDFQDGAYVADGDFKAYPMHKLRKAEGIDEEKFFESSRESKAEGSEDEAWSPDDYEEEFEPKDKKKRRKEEIMKLLDELLEEELEDESDLDEIEGRPEDETEDRDILDDEEMDELEEMARRKRSKR
jgi:hypothetical protein